ncbi:helix-turn-helix domain-containing protein [Phenylobacterium aquaticum]|uniref:helix-turn-helix domain-containing protein n=1 Tax=Phenylobacterium aquaticum TaxID=1763816 RepID=UPI0026EA0729|nr:helix-turn-helix transcriptional regulator [Phenylobacterium aquaticum]
MAKELDVDRSPNPVDLHVGLRIRLRRKELGVSQEKLADSIGLTFQQVQKYERAANRVSASKLWEMARALRTSISYFFDGLGDAARTAPGEPEGPPPAHAFLLTPEGMELAAAFPKIRKARVRRRILDLVRAMTEDDEDDAKAD